MRELTNDEVGLVSGAVDGCDVVCGVRCTINSSGQVVCGYSCWQDCSGGGGQEH